MKLVSVVGARPQFVKLGSICRAIDSHNSKYTENLHIEHTVTHTGQHYDLQMSDVFFHEMELPTPQENLGVGSGPHGQQTGRMIEQLEQVFVERSPDIVMVYGDTNSTLAAALSAAKLHIPVAHVEAGLRSFYKAMPEEINRVLTDHASTILFCPTRQAIANLQKEGFRNPAHGGDLIPIGETSRDCSIDAPAIVNVGDVMFDSMLFNLQLAGRKEGFLEELGIEDEDYYLATVHRAENTNDPKRLKDIFNAFQSIAASGRKLVCPLHPRTQKILSQLSLEEWHPNLVIIEPVSYLEMLVLEKNAQLILTDSGGVQKEAFILRKACITLREETEWVETVDMGWNLLTGANHGMILDAVEHFNRIEPEEPTIDPYGDGRASERIVQMIVSLF